MIIKKHIKYIILTSLILTIAACANNKTDSAPPPKIIQYKVDQIQSGTNMTVTAMVPMDIPNKNQPVVTNNTVFRVANNVIGSPDSTIYIPFNSLLTGVYKNDGKTCVINWQGLYGDYRALELRQGYLGMSKRLNPTSCNPEKGVQPGDILNLTFN